ncbi:MAG TPA: ParB/RepB/Spo0J family partition protein [Fimbriimonas sp.]|nr:ParB/RepB/Spo0J family partition protein [Fimbriimonas sp.]
MASLKAKFKELGSEGQNALGFDPLGGEQPLLANVAVSTIEPDPDQPRKDVGDLSELKASITRHGILQPVILSIVAEDQYRLIAGERRFTAAKELGLETVPAIIRTIEEHNRLEVQLVENIHRKELNPLEEASAYQRLIDEFKLSQRQLAQRLGKSPAAINQTIRMLSLPREILESVQTSERLSRSVLLEIAKLPNADEQLAYWTAALNGGVTVKEARAKKAGEPAPPKPHSKFPIKTKAATVTVSFDRADVDPSEVIEALSEALKIARKEEKK